jgi:hypothetical protein
MNSKIFIFPSLESNHAIYTKIVIWIDKIVVFNVEMDSTPSNTPIAIRLCNVNICICNSINPNLFLLDLKLK